MSTGIVVGCAIVLVGSVLTGYGMRVGGERERAVLAELRAALERWCDPSARDVPEDVADPTGLAPRELPRRMDRVLLARTGRQGGTGFAVVAFVECDGETDHPLLLVSLDVPAATPVAPVFSGPTRLGRRRWARRLASGLGHEGADADALERAAAEVDGALYAGDGRLVVLHYGWHDVLLRHGRPDSTRLMELLGATVRLARTLGRRIGERH